MCEKRLIRGLHIVDGAKAREFVPWFQDTHTFWNAWNAWNARNAWNAWNAWNARNAWNEKVPGGANRRQAGPLCSTARMSLAALALCAQNTSVDRTARIFRKSLKKEAQVFDAFAPVFPTSILDGFDQDARNVIARAHVEGELAEAVGAFLDVGMRLDELEHFFVGHWAGQPVAAQEKLVAILQ